MLLSASNVINLNVAFELNHLSGSQRQIAGLDRALTGDTRQCLDDAPYDS